MMITLLTDFGLSDNYVGVMKGVIGTICPEIPVIDITHHVAPQDLVEAAWSLYTAYRFFPKETVHVIVVDPGVGSKRRIVAVRTSHGLFVAPDNGVLGPVLAVEKIEAAVSIENSDWFLHPVSRTFHGRDIFAPVAARIAAGMDIDRFGPKISADQLVRLDILNAATGPDGALEGSIIAVDRFGNLVSSIGRRDIEAAFGTKAVKGLTVEFEDGQQIDGLSESYLSVAEQMPLAIIGSSDMLEISVNQGDAGAYFGKGRGDKLRIYNLCNTERQVASMPDEH